MKKTTVNLISAGHMPPNPAWHMKAHSHPFHELIVPVRGILHVRSRAQTFVIRPDMVVLYPAHIAHEEWTEKDAMESYFIGFTASGHRWRDLVIAEDQQARIRQMVLWLWQDRDQRGTHEIAAQRGLLLAILETFFRGQYPVENERVQKIRQFIRRHIREPLTLDDLAHEAGLSRFHFVRSYREWTGRTPLEEVRAIRSDYARDLILTTNLPLKEIAPAAGLGNEYSLSRIFRRQFGSPPGEFRRYRSKHH